MNKIYVQLYNLTISDSLLIVKHVTVTNLREDDSIDKYYLLARLFLNTVSITDTGKNLCTIFRLYLSSIEDIDALWFNILFTFNTTETYW